MKRARDKAVAASRAKDDFLAALSHELRTPLSPVLLLASEAAANLELSDEVRANFETIRKCVELEARLIDDLLDLTRITRDKLVLEVQALDLTSVIRDALATVKADLTAKEIITTVELGPKPIIVLGDAVRLQQVFWNVLKNAVKFTPVGGRVAITRLADRSKKRAVIVVSDTGIGITASELGRVFQAFSQGDHASGGSHQFGGLGLGLAISRRVVELHRGHITAESAGRDRGAAFRIELPLASSPNEKPGEIKTPAVRRSRENTDAARSPKKRSSSPTVVSAPALRSSVMKGRILLVEDHPPTRIALEHLLTRRGFKVRSAATAAEARAFAQTESFLVLISDIGLPDGSGYDLMKELHGLYQMPGISLTGYGMEEDVARSREAGFVQHLTKPVRIQSLDAALTQFVPNGGAR